jgi:hypothetical protein
MANIKSNKTHKTAKKTNLGETYGDESFQIVTEKKHLVTKEKEHKAKEEIEKEIKHITLKERLVNISHSDYLIYFTFILVGIIIGTILSFSHLKQSIIEANYYQNNRDLVASQNISYDAPNRVSPYVDKMDKSSMNNNKASQTNAVNPNQTINTKVEFNNGNYKIYQQADGTLLIIW